MKPDKIKIRTRFAPSPTGALHAGTVRTALFAWLSAKHAGGQFILRIEDTDQSREVSGAINNIVGSLKYLGIDWDEGPDKDGSYGPYIQSQRLELYKQWGQKLIEAGRAYADPYSKQELDEFRKVAADQKKPFLYRNHRPQNPPDWDGTRPLRFKSDPKSYHWEDQVMGKLSAGPEVVDDFIIIKSDGFPTYNFAHIIDDHLMGINLVVRSQEFISSMPIFLNLHEALDIEPPAFATVPTVLGSDGNKKLSKREGAKQLLEYKKLGILPQALMNALATTGWNDGSEQEIFSPNELISKFSLDRVQKSSARFDEQRLHWMNGHYIRELTVEKLYELVDGFWPDTATDAPKEYKLAVLGLVQQRLKYFGELPELTSFFFAEPVVNLDLITGNKQLAGISPKKLAELLSRAGEALASCDFTPESVAQTLNDLLEQTKQTPSVLFSLIRIATTWSPSSPELAQSLSVLGKDLVSKRLKQAIEALTSEK